MPRYTAKDGQDIFDLTIQFFGSVDYLFEMLTDNDINADHTIISGTEYVMNSETQGEPKGQAFFRGTFNVCNSSLDDLYSTTGDYNNDFNDDFLI